MLVKNTTKVSRNKRLFLLGSENMLVYNDQKDYTLKYNEETYSMFIPEDNFWRKVNKIVNFNYIGEFLQEKYRSTTDKDKIEIIRLFKLLLLKTYYNLSEQELLKKAAENMTFRYFLDYDLLDIDLIDQSEIVQFSHETIAETDIKKLLEKALPNVFITIKEQTTMENTAIILLDEIKKWLEN